MPAPRARAAATEWQVDVLDAAERERVLTVVTRGTQAALVLPPGESCSLDAAQLRRLDAVLAAAGDIADDEADREVPTGSTTIRPPRRGDTPPQHDPRGGGHHHRSGLPGHLGRSGDIHRHAPGSATHAPAN